ncbi:MAG: accessory Sec system protein Asp3 [Agathobacter sp.]|uniref:accessory Sec system protein Asp3 n=1 Tax=Agathobacter sp. TaxID=2021311 RepID=UPI00258F11DF|nr:accessory Sec system protein Asp3 [Agathobacter sp.]MCR5678023.1 accessory Sec system protein Asp3 [Agathobacter sp.]
MVNDKWIIRWQEYLKNSYAHGSLMKYLPDGTVEYTNKLMPPGTVIHEWFSKTNHQTNRVEPSLPLIDGESAYSITMNIDYDEMEAAGLMLRIMFYGRYDEVAGSLIVREPHAIFKPPITTYSYSIQLINGGVSKFVFRSLILREASREEYDEDQERIKKIKEHSKKSKAKRRRGEQA